MVEIVTPDLTKKRSGWACKNPRCKNKIPKKIRTKRTKYCSKKCRGQVFYSKGISSVSKGKARDVKGFVYCMSRSESPVLKIGLSRQPQKRKSQIQRELKEEIEILGKWQVKNMLKSERFLHEYFSAVRTTGEWFNISPSEAEQIGSLLDSRGYLVAS